MKSVLPTPIIHVDKTHRLGKIFLSNIKEIISSKYILKIKHWRFKKWEHNQGYLNKLFTVKFILNKLYKRKN